MGREEKLQPKYRQVLAAVREGDGNRARAAAAVCMNMWREVLMVKGAGAGLVGLLGEPNYQHTHAGLACSMYPCLADVFWSRRHESAGLLPHAPQSRGREGKTTPWPEDSLSPQPSKCVCVSPRTRMGPPLVLLLGIPTAVRLQVRSENGRPWDPPPTADSCCCCCSWVDLDVDSVWDQEKEARRTQIKNIQIHDHARSSFFPRFIPDILPPQNKGSSPCSQEFIRREEKREIQQPAHRSAAHSHTPSPHRLTAADSQQRTARTPPPPR